MTDQIQQSRRKAFEAWYLSQYDIELEPEHRANCFIGYRNHTADHSWQAFNAALDAVVIELPDCTEFDFPSGAAPAIAECRAAIEQTGLGLKIK